MKRLGTTPKRRPTVACALTIGHRTPRAPVSQGISFTVPIVADTGIGYILDLTQWTKAANECLPSLGSEVEVTKYTARSTMEESLQRAGFRDIRVIFNVTEQHYIITAKRPTPHAPPPR